MWCILLWGGVTVSECAQSWSWVRVDRPILFGRFRDHSCVFVLLVSVYLGKDLYGMTLTGIVVLQGLPCKAWQSSWKRELGFGELMNGLDLLLESSMVLLLGWGVHWDD